MSYRAMKRSKWRTFPGRKFEKKSRPGVISEWNATRLLHQTVLKLQIDTVWETWVGQCIHLEDLMAMFCSWCWYPQNWAVMAYSKTSSAYDHFWTFSFFFLFVCACSFFAYKQLIIKRISIWPERSRVPKEDFQYFPNIWQCRRIYQSLIQTQCVIT